MSRSTLPLHAQVAERLADAIAAREFVPGDRIPPERELASSLGVSRMTLRQSLDALERRGLVLRRVGRSGGTFVAGPKLERDLTAFTGLSDELRRQGRSAGARVLAAAEVEAGPAARAGLGLEPGDSVYEIERVRLADREPVALEHTSFPAARFPGLLDEPLEGPLYDLLRERYGDPAVRAVERLEPTQADTREAAALEIAVGAPLQLVERVAYAADGVPIEFSRDRFRGDRTRVVVWVSRPPEAQ
jgi:DNA-binding GntR family transcriptional regulator